MCGIAGILSLKEIEASYLTLMSSALQHRGPDGYGYMLYSERHGMRVGINDDLAKCMPDHDLVGFAHRRLSVLDLTEASLQPMQDESNTYCVTYNGELYNYLDLKKELQDLGFSFSTSGDTEVLLRSYQAWGPECLKKFNGMWAFALLDTRNRSLFISRDRFGIKPLYYMIRDQTLYFASEIKGLLAIPTLKKKPNEETIAKYLLTGLLDDTAETFFEGIAQFPAAHWAEVPLMDDRLQVRTKPYWAIPTGQSQMKEEEAVARFKGLFLDSLRIHTQSDVAVGTCLSGGLDSSSIVCSSELLRKSYDIPNFSHLTFGYCPSEETFSEKKFMDEVVKATGVEMNPIDFDQDQFEEALLPIVRAQDEPFGSAGIVAQWFVFRRASERGITVMLDGQGADEILGGYHTYFVTIALDLIRRKKFIDYLTLRHRYQKEIGPFPFSCSLLSLGAATSIIPFLNFLQPAVTWCRSLRRRNPLTPERISLNETLLEKYQTGQSVPNRLRNLNEELQTQVQSTCLPALLRYEDRNSMSHSIESRVPFLDYRIVEFLFSLPGELKIRGVTTKHILREAMKGILPEAIRIRRDKMGFKPNPNLTFSFVRNHMNLIRTNKMEYEDRWFKERGIEQILNSNDRSVAFEWFLWRIVNTKLWARQHWN